jgi:hypothetical protein
MVKLIHADDFFPQGEVESLRSACQGLNFVEKPYGLEVDNFNLIFPDSELIFNQVLGERVVVDPKKSGVLRKPNNNAIHFEDYDSTDEWCFIVALEPTVINLWHHIDNSGMGDFSKVTATSALEGTDFNYHNLFEWKIHTNILIEPNQCLFIRPWVFHSLEDGLVQYYRLLPDRKFRILVMGMPGSFKNSIAEKLAQRFDGVSIINSFENRKSHQDIDFTENGQLRHCYRLLNLARSTSTNVTIINMACPLPKMREILNPDIIVWVSDKSESEYKELNEMYVPPQIFDIECKDDNDETINNIIKRIFTKRL